MDQNTSKNEQVKAEVELEIKVNGISKYHLKTLCNPGDGLAIYLPDQDSIDNWIIAQSKQE